MSWLPEAAIPVYLGFDAGAARCGLAVAPAGEAGMPVIATALSVVATEPQTALAQRVQAALGARTSVALIAGLPLDERGAEGPAARLARALAERLAAELNVPVHFVDERFSTAAALAARRNVMGVDAAGTRREAGGKARHVSARELRVDIDAQVAAELLQSWLDAQRG
jgi:putative Holliday junction resolvase